MNKDDEYRENAAECERVARITRDKTDKRTWLDMAQHWRGPDGRTDGAGIEAGAAGGRGNHAPDAESTEDGDDFEEDGDESTDEPNFNRADGGVPAQGVGVRSGAPAGGGPGGQRRPGGGSRRRRGGRRPGSGSGAPQGGGNSGNQ